MNLLNLSMAKRKVVFGFVILLGLLLFTYSSLPKAFFQQDEWLGFGNFLFDMQKGGALGAVAGNAISHGKTHANFLTNFISFYEFRLFGINFAPYAYIALIFQLLNATLLWYLVYLFTEDGYLGYLAALFFEIYTIPHQIITWKSANSELWTLTFLLVSFIYFFHFLKNKLNKNILFSILAFIFALESKETALAAIFVYPVMWLAFLKENSNAKLLRKVGVPALILLISYGIFRSIFFILAPSSVSGQAGVQVFPSISTLVLRFLELPFKGISQIFFSQTQIISVAEKIIRTFFSGYLLSDGTVNPYISQGPAFVFVSYFLSLILAVIFLYLFFKLKKNKEEKIWKTLLFAFVVVIAGCFPLILIPGKAGSSPIFEPRQLYLPSLGASVILALLISEICKKKVLFIFLLSAVILLFNIFSTRKDVAELRSTGSIRKSILAQITEQYPSLPQNSVFFTQSDKAYYGMPISETILPVQSGFGEMLGVVYELSGQLPYCFFGDQFLYDILSQGYRVCQGRGFGYYRKFPDLLAEVKRDNFLLNSVFAFRWDSNSNKLSDITPEIRKRLITENPRKH